MRWSRKPYYRYHPAELFFFTNFLPSCFSGGPLFGLVFDWIGDATLFCDFSLAYVKVRKEAEGKKKERGCLKDEMLYVAL